METTIKPFNPNDVVDTVRDRIRATFVQLIPEEVFTRMVKAEIDHFTRATDRYYGNRETASPLQETIRHELAVMAKAKIAEVVEDPEGPWKIYWGSDGKAKVGSGIQAFLIEHSNEIVASAVGEMMQNVVSQMTRR